MAKRVDVAYYIGDQDFGLGMVLKLYNLIIPIRTKDKRHYHPIESTMTQQSLTELVPGIQFPPNPQKGDIAFSMV
jgi:hypothetical protein